MVFKFPCSSSSTIRFIVGKNINLFKSLKSPIENIPVNIMEQRKMHDIIYATDYWIIYVLSWIIIPVAQEYVVSTELTKKEKLKKAIKTNLYFYLIFSFVGLVFLIYLIFKQQLSGYFKN